jgi:pyruvate-formate lyase-activating enzyme
MTTCIRIETTNACNLRCRMCPQSDKKPGVARGLMKVDLYRNIVDQIAAFPENHNALFYLHICGEPLLHKQSVEFIRYAADLGFKPILTTNATLLTTELTAKLLASGLSRIEFSFEGVTPEIFETTRLGAKYDVVHRNIMDFLEQNRAAGKPVHTELVVVDLPHVEARLLRDYCEKMRAHFDTVNLSGYFDWLGRVETVKYERSHYRGCAATDTDLNVLWDGRVVPCCMDVDGAMVIGDFTKQCYLEILADLRRHALRERLQCGQLKGLLCSQCQVPWGGRMIRETSHSCSQKPEEGLILAGAS